MSDDRLTDTQLETLLQQARDTGPKPDAAWLARVAEEAAAARPRKAAAPSLWSQIHTALGGWQGLGGLVAACAAGVWLGVAPPAALGDPVALALGGTDTVDVFADTGFDFDAVLEDG